MLEALNKHSNTAEQQAIIEWRLTVGDEFVSTTRQELEYFNSTTFKTHNSSIAIIKPNTTEQIQKCVATANKYGIAIYSISKGNNWGYGSRVPSSKNCVILSLERMNRIVGYNEEMAYITVEPGVTFQQAYEFLKEKNSNLISPAIGSTKNASLIGNALERGVGKGVYGDRFQHCCNMEVVLPNGDIINTGFGNINNSKSKDVYRWGLGPTIDGLFSQSNFGIVTKMTFWLAVKPKHFQVIFYTIKNNEQLHKAVEALRQLRLEGTITTTSTLSNAHRIYSMKYKFPFDKVKNDNVSLPLEYVDELKRSTVKGAEWVGDDAILAPTKKIGKARAKRVKDVLGKAVDDIIFIDNTKAKILGFLAKPIKVLTGASVGELLYFYHNSFYLGKPMEKQLAICYFRKRSEVPENTDIDRDKCGVISPTISVPFRGDDVIKVLDIMKKAYEKYQLEPNIGLNFMNDRHLLFVPQIIYDREVAGHDDKAMECYNEMYKELLDAGYPPYRLGVQSMDDMVSTSPEYVNFINKLKAAIDPNNIISPNHYGIKGNL